MRFYNLIYALILILMFALESCKAVGTSSLESGGIEDTDSGSLVKIQALSKNRTAVCNAVVLSNSTLLTSSPCIERSGTTVLVKLKSKDVVNSTIVRIHPKALTSELNRIGVIVFPSKPFKNYSKVKLANYQPISGMKIKIFGYGYQVKTIEDSNVQFDVMQPMELRVSFNTLSSLSTCQAGSLEVQKKGTQVNARKLKTQVKNDGLDSLFVGYGAQLISQEQTDVLLGIANSFAFDKTNKVTDCFISPILNSNLEFLKNMVKDPAVQADIPGIDSITPLDESSFKI